MIFDSLKQPTSVFYDLFKEDSAYKEKCDLVIKLAQMFLGNPMQIVVNDSFFSGVRYEISFWTDHGIEHSGRVVEILDQLIKENRSNLKVPFSTEELYCLFCSGLLHDIGMYVKDHDFRTSLDHRKYHGLISGRILRRVYELAKRGDRGLPNPWDSFEELNIVSVLCEAHQSHVDLNKLNNMNNIRIALLAALLAIADALDIHKERAKDSFYDFFQSYLSQPSETSQFEWMINQCVQNGIHNIVIPPRMSDLFEKQLEETVTKGTNDVQVNVGIVKLKKYIEQYVDLYIGKHVIHSKVARVINCFNRGQSIKIPETIYKPFSTNFPDKGSYDDIHWVVPDYFERNNIPSLVGNLTKKLIAVDVAYDDFFIFIFDKLSSNITYWNAPNINAKHFAPNFDNKKRYRLRQTKVPLKCGIVGYLAYLGMPEAVQDIYADPRLVFSTIDKDVELGSVAIMPIVCKDNKENKNKLISMFMLNRKHKQGVKLNTFNEQHIDKIKTVLDEGSFSEEYYDKFMKIAKV